MQLKENAQEIIQDFNFYCVDNIEKLNCETADMFYCIFANSSVDTYKEVSNRIWVYEEVIPKIIEVCKDDLDDNYYLGHLVNCMKVCYGVSSTSDVLLILKDEIQKVLREWDCSFVQSITDIIDLLELVDDMLVLPEKWCSPKLYKHLGEFLKTFDCERVKYKKRVAYKNDGEFSNAQIIHIGKQLGGVSLSSKFDFYPTPPTLVERVQELANISEYDTVLEPSAGTGSLLAGLNKNNITCIELNEVLSAILKEKGYLVHNCAFEDFDFNVKYDKIIMNPPFGKRLDAKHIILAFNKYLNEGGTLVAIHSSGIKSSTDKYSKEFQKLFSEYGTLQENYNNEEFKNSGKGTTVSTCITKLVKI